jgi:hypothetical protein
MQQILAAAHLRAITPHQAKVTMFTAAPAGSAKSTQQGLTRQQQAAPTASLLAVLAANL